MKKTTATLAALFLAASATPAAAETVLVPYADLDLSTPAGQARLEARVERAIREVCGLDERRTGTRLAEPEALSCATQARAQSRTQVAALIESAAKGG